MFILSILLVFSDGTFRETDDKFGFGFVISFDTHANVVVGSVLDGPKFLPPKKLKRGLSYRS